MKTTYKYVSRLGINGYEIKTDIQTHSSLKYIWHRIKGAALMAVGKSYTYHG